MQDLRSLLKSKGCIAVDIDLAKDLKSLNASVLLGELQVQVLSRGTNSICISTAELTEETTLSGHKLREAFKLLQTNGYLTITNDGLGAPNTYIINNSNQ